jgi:hypothetical protein
MFQMRREVGVLGVLIFMALIFFSKFAIGAAPISQDSEILLDSLHNAKVDVEKLVFQQSGMIKKHQTEDQFMKMKRNIEKTFSIHLEKMTGQGPNDLVRYEGGIPLSSNVQLQIAWVGKEEQGDPSELLYTTYIIAEISSSKTEGWKNEFSYLAEKVEQLGIKPEIKTSIQGAVNRMMTKEERNRFVRQIFKSLDAKVTEGVTLDSVVSLSGFSHKLNRSVVSSDGEINLQLAAHVNQLERVTTITIGNPVIIMEY